MKTNIRIIDEVEEPSGRDVYIDRLTSRTSGTTEDTPTEAEPLDADGAPLTGYDKFCHNLTHRKPAPSSGKAGPNVR
jgi:hypothetical protein